MRAIDTNIIVRFLTADDEKQARAARTAIESGDIFVPMTVMLESEWVLRSGYGFTADQIANGLRGLAGLPAVTVEEPLLLAQALDWMREGMDFADALHLAKSDGCSAFLTFDRKLMKAAKGRSPVTVAAP
ncbi:type II toxin-antitoxin system VapC family toxin [Novosphingobium mathurense]|uniref:Predicted nucleic-acid-binding protein, contains PIN domain n=1 Tax=Novosphingobium mathurense TaxID=428990 RepID=A0A1U6GR84_9SPHN|nr:type II toxin-antitoxin system VapC family toxin [Novosphingobium mathurense]SLJ86032.1 Predicted nucleic-acid-binding protein, contains PIN domain [Novosphingobium mathurense]HKY82846.1 type II toxin-antitoxin system VapC family toxin [Sphingobium sp.]